MREYMKNPDVNPPYSGSAVPPLPTPTCTCPSCPPTALDIARYSSTGCHC